MTTGALEVPPPPRTAPTPAGSGRRDRVLVVLVPLVSIAAALLAWELISRTGLISQRDLPAMSTAFHELWNLMTTRAFWVDYLETLRGWALGIVLATVLAVPIGIVLGSSDFLGSAFRVPWDPLESTCRHASLSIL